MNRCMFVGRVASDPAYSGEGKKPFVAFNLAVRREYSVPEGQPDADFVHIVGYDQDAEYLKRVSLGKGDLLEVEARARVQLREENGKRTNETDFVIRHVSSWAPRREGAPQETTEPAAAPEEAPSAGGFRW